MNPAEAEHRLSQTQRLRLLFNEPRWFTNVEIEQLTGMQRWGARIFELRRGQDGGPPLNIETERVNESGSQYRYRCHGVSDGTPTPKPRSLKARLAEAKRELESVNAALAAANEELAKRRQYRAPGVISFVNGVRV